RHRRDRIGDVLGGLARTWRRRLRRALDGPEDVRGDRLLHLGQGDASTPALRPADELRLEGAASARDSEPAGDRNHRDGGLSDMTYRPEQDAVPVERGPEPGGL